MKVNFFDLLVDENNNKYFSFLEKLSNNQTLDLRFYIEDDYTYFYITGCIYSKRKNYEKLFSKEEVSGKIGLESLLLAKLGIRLFIEFIKEKDLNINSDVKIVIKWSDNRRRRVYYRGLKDLGFKYDLELNDSGTQTKKLIKIIKKEK